MLPVLPNVIFLCRFSSINRSVHPLSYPLVLSVFKPLSLNCKSIHPWSHQLVYPPLQSYLPVSSKPTGPVLPQNSSSDMVCLPFSFLPLLLLCLLAAAARAAAASFSSSCLLFCTRTGDPLSLLSDTSSSAVAGLSLPAKIWLARSFLASSDFLSCWAAAERQKIGRASCRERV